MARKVIIGEQELDCSSAVQSRQSFQGSIRQVIVIRISTDYATAKSLFDVDDLHWGLRTDEGFYDHSDYNILGDITDHLDGTISIKLGLQYTEAEKLNQQVTTLQSDVRETRQNITTIAGEPVADSAAAEKVRAQIETIFEIAVASCTTDQKISMRSLCETWQLGNHKLGEVYRTVGYDDAAIEGQIWECIQAYDNATYPDIIPTNKSTWGTFNKPYHGKTVETALPWVAPTGAHDIYKSGEYMLWTDGKVKKCLQDTNYSPEEYAQAWQDAETE